MGFCKKLFWGIVLIVLAFLSLGGFLVFLEIIPSTVIEGILASLKQEVLLRGILVSFFGFLFVLSITLSLAAREKVKETIIPLKNPLGEVEISQKAICDFIQRVGKEVEGVEDIRARIKPSDEGMSVFLVLSAQAQGEIPRLINELQTVVKNYLNNTVGIENIREIKVKVSKIL